MQNGRNRTGTIYPRRTGAVVAENGAVGWGHTSSGREKGCGNCPRPLARLGSGFLPETRFLVLPPFPHRLCWGGEAPSGNCSLKAKTQRLVKCFEGEQALMARSCDARCRSWAQVKRAGPAPTRAWLLCPPSPLLQRRFNGLWAGSVTPGISFSSVNKLKMHLCVVGGKMRERRFPKWLETLIKKKRL